MASTKDSDSPEQQSTDATLDVVGVGNAIVDALAHATDGQIAQLGLAKGADDADRCRPRPRTP